MKDSALNIAQLLNTVWTSLAKVLGTQDLPLCPTHPALAPSPAFPRCKLSSPKAALEMLLVFSPPGPAPSAGTGAGS